MIDGKTIVTNGDQTDTVYNFLKEGKTSEEALRTREFEPDGPNWTPRISAVIKGESVQMSILKSEDVEGSSCIRNFFEYESLKAGTGRFISTYKHNGNPIPSFEGEPMEFEMVCQPFDEWSNDIWNALNSDNKVSLFTRVINIETGEHKSMIFNKNN